MSVKLVNIDKVFNYIPNTMREQLSDDSQIKSWALQALRTVEHSERYVKDVWFADVINHKVELPEDLHKIYKFSYAAQEPTDLEIDSLCACKAQTDSANYILETNCLPVYHNLFLNSAYYKNTFSPMAYKKTRLTDYYVCNVQWGGCYGHYSLDSAGKVATVSEKSGFVAIEYFAEAKDEEGHFIVPDLEQLWQGMAAWAKAKFFEENIFHSEQGSDQRRGQFMIEARQWLNEARGILKLRNIDTSLHRAMVHGSSRILKAHLTIKTHD